MSVYPPRPGYLPPRVRKLVEWSSLGLALLCFFLAGAPFLPGVGPFFTKAYKTISQTIGAGLFFALLILGFIALGIYLAIRAFHS